MHFPHKASPYAILISVLFAALLLGFVAGYRKAQDDADAKRGITSIENGLAVSLRVDKPDYHLKDTVQATVRFENVSEDGFLINTIFQFHSIDYWYRFEDMNGKIYDNLVRLNHRGWFYGVHGFSYLQPNEAIEVTDQVEISRYVQEPGEYNLLIIYANEYDPDPGSYTHPEYQVRTTWKGITSASTSIRIKP